MELKHIAIEQLSVSRVNMRGGKKGADIAGILPSVRARGVLVPLIVRANGSPDTYEIVAGRRRYEAACALASEAGEIDPLPCAVIDAGDDAAALEASLIENIARLDPDEVTQWETFTRLIREGRSAGDIALTFGLTDLQVRRTLALGNLLPRIRSLYRRGEIDAATVRHLTLATKAQQRDWLALLDDPNVYCPSGQSLKAWLFGGDTIPVSAALFDLASFDGEIISDLLGEQEEMAVACADNGCGLGDEQLKAFLTKDTSYKDDLGIAGIGKCKGAGRIQFFHHFTEMAVDTRYRAGDEVFRRTMHFAEPRKQIEFEDFTTVAAPGADLGTTIRLSRLKDFVRERVFQNERLSDIFAAPTLRRVMLVAFLQRLVGLADELGDFEIRFRTRHWKQDEKIEWLRRADLPKITREVPVKVEEHDPRSGDALGTHQIFTLSHYQLDATDYDLPRNAIAFCAKSSPVKDITAYYLRTKTEQRNPVGGFHHIVLIESEYLDGHVNEQRDDFDEIPQESGGGERFGGEKLSYTSIHDVIDPVIEEMVAPADWKKEEVLKEIVEHFGVGAGMLADTETRIRHGDSAQQVVERVLRKYQERVINATAEIFDLKEDIIKTQPDTDEFRTKINELSWKYTASLKDFDMANLSQLIVRRAAIVEILDLACRKQLAMQTGVVTGKRRDERIIHSIFFPMRKDSTEFADHDIWLLSEEYQYYDHIASDKPLAQIPWSETEKIFDSDIDEEFRKLLQKRADDNAGKRPDIALFNKEGSAIIVEVKAPDVSLDDHIGDLFKYAHLLSAKSRGKLRKFYCYLIGDTINPMRLNNWIPFPDGKGYFQASTLLDPETRAPLGEIYSEMLYFDDLVARAKKRIAVYQQKLKIDLRSGR